MDPGLMLHTSPTVSSQPLSSGVTWSEAPSCGVTRKTAGEAGVTPSAAPATGCTVILAPSIGVTPSTAGADGVTVRVMQLIAYLFLRVPNIDSSIDLRTPSKAFSSTMKAVPMMFSWPVVVKNCVSTIANQFFSEVAWSVS